MLGTYTFPDGFSGKETACKAGNLDFIPGLGRSPGERMANPHPPLFLPGEFCGQRSLACYSPWGPKESDITEGLTLYLLISLHATSL